jgi:hypothetical protein
VHVTLNVIFGFFFHKSLPKESWHFCRILNVLCDQGIYAVEDCRVQVHKQIIVQYFFKSFQNIEFIFSKNQELA